jgi:glycerophosphoryl diester phosphodiesterase
MAIGSTTLFIAGTMASRLPVDNDTSARARSNRFALGRRRPNHPGMAVLYAHRGAPTELPENTLPSFRRALVGATAIETDVHLTRDGHVVISHDPDGRRNAGVARAIRDATLAEVRMWDVGRAFRAAHPDAPPQSFTMPTLAEVLDELPGVPLNVDIKRTTPGRPAPSWMSCGGTARRTAFASTAS